MAKHSWKLITFTEKRATCTACSYVDPGTSDKTSNKTFIKRLFSHAIVRTKNRMKSTSRKHTDFQPPSPTPPPHSNMRQVAKIEHLFNKNPPQA